MKPDPVKRDDSHSHSPPPDLVARALDAWRHEWPTLDFSPVSVVARLIRAVGFVELELEGTLREFGLNRASFDTLTALRRAGPSYQLSARQLAESCMRTSSTLTTRIARLADAGLIERKPDPHDARSVLVRLTDEGRAVIDAVGPRYLAAEADLLAGLSDDQRAQLARLLQMLLLGLEGPSTGADEAGHPISRLGLQVEPAHVALRRRRSVGLPDRVGLLVCAIEPSGPADLGGIAVGDLITHVDAHECRSAALLNQALDSRRTRAVTVHLVRGTRSRTAALHLRPPR